MTNLGKLCFRCERRVPVTPRHGHPLRSPQLERRVAGRSLLVALLAVGAHAADVGQQPPRLARHVGAMYQESVFGTRVALASSSWCSIQAFSPAAVGSMTVRPCSRIVAIVAVIHSVCCCRQVVMLHRAADGASGIAVVSMLGKPSTMRPIVERISRLHSSARPAPAAATDVDPRQRAGTRVEPGRHDDHVQLVDGAVGELDALGHDLGDRVLPHADELDVVAVVDLVVAALQRHPVGTEAEVLVGRHQDVDQVLVLEPLDRLAPDERRDLPADLLGEEHLTEPGQPQLQRAVLVDVLQDLQAPLGSALSQVCSQSYSNPVNVCGIVARSSSNRAW